MKYWLFKLFNKNASVKCIHFFTLYILQAWCRLLTAVTNFTEKYQTMFSSIILMQKLLYFSLHAVHVSCTGHDTGPDVLAVVSIVAELFEYYCTGNVCAACGMLGSVLLCYARSSNPTDYSSHVPQFKTTICSIEVRMITCNTCIYLFKFVHCLY